MDIQKIRKLSVLALILILVFLIIFVLLYVESPLLQLVTVLIASPILFVLLALYLLDEI